MNNLCYFIHAICSVEAPRHDLTPAKLFYSYKVFSLLHILIRQDGVLSEANLFSGADFEASTNI